MKKLAYILAIIVCTLTASCSSEIPIGPGGIVAWEEIYHYDISDTTLSADSHEFILEMTGDELPRDWNLVDLFIFEDEENVPDTIDTSNWPWYHPAPEVMTISGNKYELDWISFEKIPTSSSPKLKISVKKNETKLARGVKFAFGKVDKPIVYFGDIVIMQKGMPDMEPYTMKIRYKGKTYTTSAHLNINEEIEFDNSEFSQIMDEIDNLEKVEAIVMEDDIVDYFDMSDNNNSKAISKLRQKLASGTRCDVRTDLPMTRGKDAYRFENADAIGYFAMFDDTGFDDSYVFANLKHLTDISDQYYMRDIGLNDKVSSLAVSYKGSDPEACAVLTIWEDSFYNHGDNDRTKHRISIIATKDNPRVSMSSLKKVKCINSGNSWNDRISSYSFGFGNYDHYLKNY